VVKESDHHSGLVRICLLDGFRLDLSKLFVKEAAVAVDGKLRLAATLQPDPDGAGRVFSVVRDLVNKVFVRGVSEQFGRPVFGVGHGTNLARVLIAAIRPFGYGMAPRSITVS
jgi:hypothetical protein